MAPSLVGLTSLESATPAVDLVAGRYLYRWQLDALTSWLRCGRRGVVEAVTGSGKTNVALAAALDAHRRGLFVLVVVPSRVLMEQWHQRLTEVMPDGRIGRLGDNFRDQPKNCDVLITTRHSASARDLKPPTETGGLLIADECHGFGGSVLRKSLHRDYNERLGLTATFERSDDAVDDILMPYFGGVCFRYGFAEAISDGVCAQPRVAFVAVPLSEEERFEYIETEDQLVKARSILRAIPALPQKTFGEFLGAVNYLADNDAGPHGRAANDYLQAFGKRREIVANSTSKYEALGRFAESIKAADGSLLFTETVRAANHAVNRLDVEVAIEIITGSTGRKAREKILGDLRTGTLDAVAAPRVLDEGIDVPNANLGIVVSASRTRRQMIQRMGRILRRKEAGSGACFVIIFARNTLEDPTMSEDRDGFLDEIEAISERSHIFNVGQLEELAEYLDYQGPGTVIEPIRVGPFVPDAAKRDADDLAAAADSIVDGLASGWAEVTSPLSSRTAGRDVIDTISSELGFETLYAHMSFLAWSEPTWLHEKVWAQADDRLPTPPPPSETKKPDPELDDRPYLEIEKMVLPELSKERAKKQRLSTGEQPVQLVAVGSEWVVRCVGCGAESEPMKFKWQAMDETVECSCWR